MRHSLTTQHQTRNRTFGIVEPRTALPRLLHRTLQRSQRPHTALHLALVTNVGTGYHCRCGRGPREGTLCPLEERLDGIVHQIGGQQLVVAQQIVGHAGEPLPELRQATTERNPPGHAVATDAQTLDHAGEQQRTQLARVRVNVRMRVNRPGHGGHERPLFRHACPRQVVACFQRVYHADPPQRRGVRFNRTNSA